MVTTQHELPAGDVGETVSSSRSIGRDFGKFWLAQTTTLVASQLMLLALPLTAVLLLKASPVEMGVLRAVEYAPFLLLGLFAGVWVDRVRRRPLLISTNAVRAVLLAGIPVAVLAGILRIEQLYVLSFLAGCMAVLFEVAYPSYVVTLVRRTHLVAANGRLEMSQSLAYILGPAIGGLLVQQVSASAAIIVTVVLFLIAGVVLGLMRVPEPVPAPPDGHHNIWQEIGEGLRLVLGQPLLRAIVINSSIVNLCFNITFAVLVLFAVRELTLSPGVVGVLFAVFGLGGVAGALAATPAARLFGEGPTMVAGVFLMGVGSTAVPAAFGPAAAVILLVAAGLIGFGLVLYNVNQRTVRQLLTPDHLQGRQNATVRFVSWGVMPVGALLGGAIGQSAGLRAALLASGILLLAGAFLLLASPARTLRDESAADSRPPAAPPA